MAPDGHAFPSGRTAEDIVVGDAAGLAWIVNLGCIELYPHPVSSNDRALIACAAIWENCK